MFLDHGGDQIMTRKLNEDGGPLVRHFLPIKTLQIERVSTLSPFGYGQLSNGRTARSITRWRREDSPSRLPGSYCTVNFSSFST